MTLEKEKKKLKEQIQLLELDVEKLQFEIETLKGKISALPGQRCSSIECTNLLIDKRQPEHYILHVILEVIAKDGIRRSETFAFHCAICLYRWLIKSSEEEFTKELDKLGWNQKEGENEEKENV